VGARGGARDGEVRSSSGTDQAVGAGDERRDGGDDVDDAAVVRKELFERTIELRT
jgi:hypothetical protein